MNLSAKDLALLTESMGFNLIRAQKGLLNSTSIEGAIDWILSHEHDPDIDDPISVDPKAFKRSTKNYEHNSCHKIIVDESELDRPSYAFKETSQGIAEEKLSSITPKEQNSLIDGNDGLRNLHGVKIGEDEMLSDEETQSKRNKSKEELEKELILQETKLQRKKKHQEMIKERERIKAEIARDRLELQTKQLKPPSTTHSKLGHETTESYAGADQAKSSSYNNEPEKEAILEEAKLQRKKKHQEMIKERERIKAEIARDRLELQTKQLKPPSTTHSKLGHETTENYAGADQAKSSSYNTEPEKEAILEEAKLQRKKKHHEMMKERERIKAEIARDRIEFKMRHGESLPPAERNGVAAAKRRHSHHDPVPNKTRKGEVSKIDNYIHKISLYRAGDYGGKCLKILWVYLKNVIENPQEKKYRRIKMDNKIYKMKVKPINGAKMLLSAVGFLQDDNYGVLVLPDAANMKVLEETKRKLEIAYASYFK